MKKYISLLMIALLSISCNGQNNEANKEKPKEKTVEQPKGTWRVNKEFDENGNLIKYDSIYSWSSDGKYDDLTLLDKDSLLQSFKSKFFSDFSYLKNQGFDDVFAQDSLFSKNFFNDDFFNSNFGKDFMDIDKIRERMVERQKKFLEKYQSEFKKSEEENKK